MKIEINGEKLRISEVFLFLANEGYDVKLYDDDDNIIGWRNDKEKPVKEEEK